MSKQIVPPSLNLSLPTANKQQLYSEQSVELTPWLAMSLFQKAIRRGTKGLAHVAAASLLQSDPERLRRRIAVILFEDVGIGAPDMIASVLPAVTRRGWSQHGRDGWGLVPSLIDQMCESAKCRAVDDLLVVIGWDPSLEGLKRDIGSLNSENLLKRLRFSTDVIERAISLLYFSGNLRSQENISPAKQLGPTAVWNSLREIGCSENLISLARLGKTSGAGEMPIIHALLSLYKVNGTPVYVSDQFPSEGYVGGVPGWAFDVHVREGNRALSAFLKTDAVTAKLVREHVPGSGQRAFLGGLLFRVESGLVSNRFQWSLGAAFKSIADTNVHGVDPEIAQQISQQLTRDIPLLNEVRRHVVTSNPL